jgi:hypothetical protein
MNFPTNTFYKPNLSPNGKYSIVYGEESEQAMGGAYRASCFLWQKGHPVFEIHERAAGLGIWTEDSQMMYFPIWFNDTLGYLKQRLAGYDLKQEKLIVFKEEYGVLSLQKIENKTIFATLSPLFQPKEIELNLDSLKIESIQELAFKKHEDYYDFQHPVLHQDGVIYNNEPNAQIYVQYCIRGHVNAENDKVFYQKQMMQLHDLLNPMMQDWKFKRVFMDVAKFRPVSKKPDAEGAVRITGTIAPNGGRRNVFNAASFQKVSSLHIVHNPNLVNDFNQVYDKGILYLSHPKGLPTIFRLEIYGRKNSIKVPNWTYDYCTPMHFYLQCDNGIDNHKNAAINQRINVWMPRNLMSVEAMDDLIKEIGKIAFATAIYKSETACYGLIVEDENGNISSSYRTNENIEDAIEGKNKYGRDWEAVL